jgi:putative membrane protein
MPHAAAYLFFSCAACTAMGIVITFAPAPLYREYAKAPMALENWGISPQMDQQIGGLLMWVPACLIYLAAIMAMFARWYAEETATLPPAEGDKKGCIA